ncbi:hypothetical protein ACFLXE_08810 [Chloroflexota bacterium]
MNKSIIIHTLLILVLVAITVVGCGSSGGEENEILEGSLPTLEVGDQWVCRQVQEGYEYVYTLKVIGKDIIRGRRCYVFEMGSDDPLPMSLGNTSGEFYGELNFALDKETYQEAAVMMAGTLTGEGFSIDLAAEEYSSYTFPDAFYWPLEVGKESTVVVTESTSITALGQTQTNEEERTEVRIVESIEDITVAAGTFRCFKVIVLDEEGKKLRTYWYSDKVRWEVKSINHEDGQIDELISYSSSNGTIV